MNSPLVGYELLCLNAFPPLLKLEKARQEARSKDEYVRKLEESLQNIESKAKSKDQIQKSQQDKIKELESQLDLKTALHNQSDMQVSQLSDRLIGREEICYGLQQKVCFFHLNSH